MNYTTLFGDKSPILGLQFPINSINFDPISVFKSKYLYETILFLFPDALPRSL